MFVQRGTRSLRALGFLLLTGLALGGSSPGAQAGSTFTGGGQQITFNIGPNGQLSQPTPNPFAIPGSGTGVTATPESTPNIAGTGDGISLSSLSFKLNPAQGNTSTTAVDYLFSAQRGFGVTSSTGASVSINGEINSLTATGKNFSGSITVSGFIQIPQNTSTVSPFLLPGQVAYVSQSFNFSVNSQGVVVNSQGSPLGALIWSPSTTTPSGGGTTNLTAGGDSLVEQTEIKLKNFVAGDSLTVDPTFNVGVTPHATPEPASMTLAGLGVAPLAWMAWRRRRLRRA